MKEQVSLKKLPLHTQIENLIFNASVASKVKSIIVDKLGVEPYEVNDYSSWSDLGADSLDAVELIMEFEKEFSMTIPDQVAEHIRTVGDAVNYIEKHR